AVDGDLGQDLPAVRLEAAVEVMEVDLGEAAGHPVEQERGEPLARRILPALLPAGDEVEVLLLEDGEEAGDLLRVVLEVTIHGDDDRAARVVEAGAQGRGLAEVAAQADELDPGIPAARPAPPA